MVAIPHRALSCIGSPLRNSGVLFNCPVLMFRYPNAGKGRFFSILPMFAVHGAATRSNKSIVSPFASGSYPLG